MRALATGILCLLVSCTTPRSCSCRGEDVGPLEPPAPPKEAIELIEQKDGSIMMQFKPDNFPDCAALEVVYDDVDYGIIIPGTPLYVQQIVREETHTLDITCLDDLGLPLRKSEMVI